MKTNAKKIMKSEKGSITLFVLCAMLFFLIVVVTSYIYTKNKSMAQDKQYLEIKNQYENTKTLEAEYQEEVVDENIEYTITWANGKATVNLTTKGNLKIQVSKDGVTYSTLNKIKDLNSGDIVYARVSNGDYYGKAIPIQVLDTTKPKLTLSYENVKTNQFTIKAKAEDNESGIEGKKYNYYLSNILGEFSSTPNGSNTEGSYTFSNLDQNSEYTVKVVIEDNAQNEQISTIKVKTEVVPSAQTSINKEIVWNSNGTALIYLTTQTKFEILYSKDRTTWQKVENGIQVNNGEKIYTCLTDGNNKGEDATIEAKDFEGPSVNVAKQKISSNQITVNVVAQDKVSGMGTSPKYNYYIKENGTEEWILQGKDILTNTFTYTGLKAEKTYNIKVTTQDIVGNVGEGELSLTTNEFTYIKGNIQFNNVKWENKQAQVTALNNTEYTMQYKIIKDGETLEYETGWIAANNKEIIIQGLKNKDQVIARLTDGVNISGYALITIEDTTAPKINVTGIPDNWTKNDVTIEINAEDTESGLQENAYSFDGGVTWQKENTKTYTENTMGIVIKVRDEAGNIETYETINIEKIDKQGPTFSVETESTSNSITVNVEEILDTQVGIEEPIKIKYYITTNKSELENIEGEELTETTKEYTKLNQNTTYYIKVEIQDKLGNIGKIYKTVITGSLNANAKDINIADITWENKKAKTTITNNSNYNLQYQVVKSGETLNENANWTTITEKTIELTNLLNGDTIYTRLTDGNNVSGTIIKEVKDTTAPTLDITGNTDQWVNTDITLTINASDDESGLQENAYSFDGGITWQKENTKTYTENTEGIVIEVRDEAGNIAIKTINISKIDKKGPNITLQESQKTTKEITIEISEITDEGVGMSENPTYVYYIKSNNENDFTKIKESTEKTQTFTKLKSGTTYTIKVEAEDSLGNKSEKTIDIATKNMLYQENIKFENLYWTNSKAQVTVTNSSEFNMQYQIGKNNASIDIAGKWTNVQEKTIDLKELETGDIIYARLTDGVNTTTGYAVCTVTNSAKQTYTDDELAKQTNLGTFNILGISSSENEIKVQIDSEQQKSETYNYYYKTINDDEYKLISTNSYYNQTAIITNIKKGNIYSIKVIVTDENGNKTRSQNTAVIIALENAETDTIYEENRTYIDNSTQLDNKETGSKINAGYTVSLPASFKVSANDNLQKNGIIILDKNNNEFVWIPVNSAIYDDTTNMPVNSGTAARTYKPMVKKQTDYTNYYESIPYTFNSINSWKDGGSTIGLGKSGYREPSLLTNKAEDGYTWNMDNVQGTVYDADSNNYKTILGFENIKTYGIYLQNSYNNMITAVDSYGGFYVGRYETTYENDGENVIVGSKANATVLSEMNWYKMLLYQDSEKYTYNPYNKIGSVNTNMMWGSQWDAMLNYILHGNDNKKVTQQIASQKNVKSNSKQDENDIINNIYDLNSNVYEWTQETTEISGRIYRGGSYDSSISSNASIRRSTVPTDSGPALGSRIGMYVKNANDVTGPATKITSTSATSNTITVSAEAVDKESGVSKYYYYIKNESGEWELKAQLDSRNYTYTQLKQNTQYEIKVQAIDGAGNIGDEAIKTVQTEKLGNIAKSAIKRIQKYGANGTGVIQLELDETYKNSGYNIKYQVKNQGETADLNGTWTKGEIINNLSNGQILYAVVSDEINTSSDYYKETVDGLEEYAYIDSTGKTYTEEEAKNTKMPTTYNTTIAYTDENEKTATIPAGFKVGTAQTVKNIDNGLVIQDKDGNEFVWIPVENVIETDKKTTSTEKAMARYQSGYTENSTKKYYEAILYDFSGTTSTKKSASNVLGTNANREPTLVTNGADYTWNILKGQAKGNSYDLIETYYKYLYFGTTSGVKAFNSYTEMGQYINQEYANMIQSVKNYNGFYVSRYEISTYQNNSSKDAIVQSKANQTPISNKSWYQDYYYQDSKINSKNPYSSSKSVISSMIWGSQWDAMINWLLKYDDTKNFVTQITGNHTQKVEKTGTFINDIAKNIFDLAGNVSEWTQEGRNTIHRQYRGGNAAAITAIYTRSASGRFETWSPPTTGAVYTHAQGESEQVKSYLGSRMSLYIKETKDTTPPEIEVTNTTVGTNNIEIEVNANDKESGIQSYKYSISYKNFEDESFNEQTDILKEEVVYGSTYTFTGLEQNQSYYIKVEVTNNSSLKGVAYTGLVKTDVLSVSQGAIILEKVYGKNGNGTAYFEINSSTNFEQEGYYLQHQVDKKGANGYKDSDSSYTIKGNTVTGLSVGDVIYSRIYDGKNKASYYMITTITELETFSEVKTTTEEYNDYTTQINEDGTKTEVLEGTAYIPAGFKVATSSITKKIKDGLVIEDENQNQYVWIPVNKNEVVYDGKTAISDTYKPMVRYQKGYNANSTNQYFESIYYYFSGVKSTASTGNRLGTSNSREPSLVTGSNSNYSWIFSSGNNYDAKYYTQLSGIGVNSAESMGTYMNNKYTEIVQSVKKYGGYYVGRYETSLWKTNTDAGTSDRDGEIVKSVANAVPMASTNWYSMYQKQSSDYAQNPYKTSTSVGSSMIWASQWDTMLNYILKGSDKGKVNVKTGNHTGSRASTGKFGNDIMNNIFDLGSNVREWTTEASGSSVRVLRGGYYAVDSTNPASNRQGTYVPTRTGYLIGSRLTLYVK